MLLPAGIPEPSDVGLIAWNYPSLFAEATGFTTISGTVYAVKIRLDPRRQISVTNIEVAVETAGSTLTAGQNLAGLYDPGLNLLGVSGDQSGVFNTVGWKQCPLASAPIVGSWPYLWAAIMSNGTTPAKFSRAAGASVGLPIVVRNVTDTSVDYGTFGVGQTALPAHPAFVITGGFTPWVGLS
jgi:hypothetical protein